MRRACLDARHQVFLARKRRQLCLQARSKRVRPQVWSARMPGRTPMLRQMRMPLSHDLSGSLQGHAAQT